MIRSPVLNFTLCVFSLTLMAGCRDKRPLYKETRVMMGTFIEVVSPDSRASEVAFDELKRIEKLLSKYDPESEVSQLNKLGKLKASPETFFVIRESVEFWRLSGGAFDITVAPLIDLWGFTERDFRVPKAGEIDDTLRLVGSDKIHLNNEDNMIEFSLSGMKIDLGAIAKGYALDCAAVKLKKKGINSCLINAGGQVYCLGSKFGSPWKIAVKSARGKDFSGFLELKDKSVSTSGDYEQYFIKDNKRYSHILNPRTGYPVDNGIKSVTVIAPDGLTADALSTSIFVLGREKGLGLAKKFPGVKVDIYD